MHHHASASLARGIHEPHRQADGGRDSLAIGTNPFPAARRDPGGTPLPTRVGRASRPQLTWFGGLLLEFEEYFEAHLVIGITFLIGAAAGLVAGFLLLAGPYRVGWSLGALVAGGTLSD
jgi:hypothetical protein